MVEWIKQDTKEWVPFYFIKWHTYAYSYVLENIDIDTSLEERINKRLSLFTLYVFVFVFIYLFFWLALYKGEGEYWSRAGKKKINFLTLFLLIHKTLPFASLLERFTTGMKSLYLNEIFSSPHFFLESKNISVSTDYSYMHSLRTNIVFLIWLEDILAYLFFLLSSSFQSSNLFFFVLPHSSKVLRPNQMLSYIPHYFLENLWESYNSSYLVDAETKVLTETGLMSFSFDNSYGTE